METPKHVQGLIPGPEVILKRLADLNQEKHLLHSLLRLARRQEELRRQRAHQSTGGLQNVAS